MKRRAWIMMLGLSSGCSGMQGQTRLQAVSADAGTVDCKRVGQARCTPPAAGNPDDDDDKVRFGILSGPGSGVGGPQGNYIEGRGLENVHFEGTGFPTVTLGVQFDPVIDRCGNSGDPGKVTFEYCEPYGGLGALVCNVKSEKQICGANPSSKLGYQDLSPILNRGVIVVGGHWDSSGLWHKPTNGEVTLSCDSAQNEKDQHGWADGAIANCVRGGFYPKTYAIDGKDEDEHDQFLACIRAMRADYCGDGHSFTNHGTNIEISETGPGTKKNFVKTHQCDDGRYFEADWSKLGVEVFRRRRWVQAPGEAESLPSACSGNFEQKNSKHPKYWVRKSGGSKPSVSTRTTVNFCPIQGNPSQLRGGMRATNRVDADDDRCP